MVKLKGRILRIKLNEDYKRKILESQDLFVIAQDAFMKETVELADIVLPATIWGEKLVPSLVPIELSIFLKKL